MTQVAQTEIMQSKSGTPGVCNPPVVHGPWRNHEETRAEDGHQSKLWKLNQAWESTHAGDVTGLWLAGGAGRKDGGSWGAAIRRGEGKTPL